MVSRTLESRQGDDREIADAEERLIDARDRGLAWVLARIDDDGAPIDSEIYNGYYRLPWALSAAGARGVAARTLRWIEDSALDPSGDLREGVPREKFTYRAASYPLSVIACGAWHLERYDLTNLILNRLQSGGFIDPRSGGLYEERVEDRKSTRQKIFPTAQFGMTALVAGRTRLARRVFRRCLELYRAQPELPERLYACWDENGLITDVAGADEMLSFDLVTDFAEPRQASYNPGITAAFCGRYFAATGDVAARELGRAMIRISAASADSHFDAAESRQICKLGWAAASMLDADPAGESRYLGLLLEMVDWFCDCQEDDGHWYNSPFLDPDPTQGSKLEITTEFVLHLTTILSALGGLRRHG